MKLLLLIILFVVVVATFVFICPIEVDVNICMGKCDDPSEIRRAPTSSSNNPFGFLEEYVEDD